MPNKQKVSAKERAAADIAEAEAAMAKIERARKRKKDNLYKHDEWLAALDKLSAARRKRMAAFDAEDKKIQKWLGIEDDVALRKEVFDIVCESKEICGIPFDRVELNFRTGFAYLEEHAHYDMLGINDSTAVLIDTKLVLCRVGLWNLLRDDLPVFPDKCRPEYIRGRKLVCAVVYRTLRQLKAAQEALSAGVLLLHAKEGEGLRQIKTLAAARKTRDENPAI